MADLNAFTRLIGSAIELPSALHIQQVHNATKWLVASPPDCMPNPIRFRDSFTASAVDEERTSSLAKVLKTRWASGCKSADVAAFAGSPRLLRIPRNFGRRKSDWLRIAFGNKGVQRAEGNHERKGKGCDESETFDHARISLSANCHTIVFGKRIGQHANVV